MYHFLKMDGWMFPFPIAIHSQVEEASDRSGNDDDMEKRVAKLSESLEKREEQAMDLNAEMVAIS